MLGVAYNRFLPWLTRVLNTPAPALQIPVRHLVGSREVTLLTPELVRTVHRAGKQVHVWTVDDQPTIERLVKGGIPVCAHIGSMRTLSPSASTQARMSSSESGFGVVTMG